MTKAHIYRVPTENTAMSQVQNGVLAFWRSLLVSPRPHTLCVSAKDFLLLLHSLLHSLLSASSFPGLDHCYFLCLDFPKYLLCSLNSYVYFNISIRSDFLYDTPVSCILSLSLLEFYYDTSCCIYLFTCPSSQPRVSFLGLSTYFYVCWDPTTVCSPE